MEPGTSENVTMIILFLHSGVALFAIDPPLLDCKHEKRKTVISTRYRLAECKVNHQYFPASLPISRSLAARFLSFPVLPFHDLAQNSVKKPCILDFQILRTVSSLSTFKAKLKTGRY